MSSVTSSQADSQVDRFWTRDELEIMVQWLEEPANLRRTVKGSGETKKNWIKAINELLPGRTYQQVLNKFDNLKKSHRDASKMNEGSGWGLTADDLTEGKRTLREKLLSKCPFFFRLEEIWGSRPNIHPPISFNSATDPKDTRRSSDCLINLLENTDAQHSIEELVEIESSPALESESVVDSDFPPIPELQRVSSQPIREDIQNPIRTSQTPIRSRKFPPPINLQSDEEDENQTQPKRKKRRVEPMSLGDAITQLSAARISSEEKKLEFLKHQLEQQERIRKEEIDLERERLEIEREKAQTERMRLEYFFRQNHSSMSDF